MDYGYIKTSYMNRNILISSLLIAGFFMFLSFILRMLFFTTFTSLIQQPLVIFISWFGAMVLIFYFLKNDFPEIYKQFVFFAEKTPQTEVEEKGENLNLLNEDDTDYGDVFNHSESQDNKGDNTPSNDLANSSPINKMIDNNKSIAVQQEQANKNTTAYRDAFSKQDPKKLAGLIKNYLNKE